MWWQNIAACVRQDKRCRCAVNIFLVVKNSFSLCKQPYDCCRLLPASVSRSTTHDWLWSHVAGGFAFVWPLRCFVYKRRRLMMFGWPPVCIPC